MPKRSTNGRNDGRDLVAGEGREVVERELDPLEEHVVSAVGVLLGVDDVAAVPVHEVGDGGHEARPIRTGEQQHRGGVHLLGAHPERFTTSPAMRRVIPAGVTLENAPRSG